MIDINTSDFKAAGNIVLAEIPTLIDVDAS